MDRKKTTIMDVANKAGVSIATVSRVINNTDMVKESTRNRVLAAIEDTGYEIDFLHESEPLEKVVLFNMPSISNPFYQDIINGVKVSAAKNNIHIIINEDHIISSTVSEFLALIKRINPIGIVTVNHIPTPALKQISETIPIIQCGEYNDDLDLSYVSVDDVKATQQAVSYLISLGKRRIALINGPEYYKYAKHRLIGYRKSLEAANIEYDPSIVVNLSDVNYELAITSASQLLNSSNRPDAFFTCSDTYAVAVIRAAYQYGIAIPDELAVIGYDNTDITTFTIPTLTSISQPAFQLGFTACELLIAKTQNPNFSPKHIILETELILRESTRQL